MENINVHQLINKGREGTGEWHPGRATNWPEGGWERPASVMRVVLSIQQERQWVDKLQKAVQKNPVWATDIYVMLESLNFNVSNIMYLLTFIRSTIWACVYEKKHSFLHTCCYTHSLSFSLFGCMYLIKQMLPLSRVSPPKAPHPQLPVAIAERCLLLVLLRKNPQYAWDKCARGKGKRREIKSHKRKALNIFLCSLCTIY